MEKPKKSKSSDYIRKATEYISNKNIGRKKASIEFQVLQTKSLDLYQIKFVATATTLGKPTTLSKGLRQDLV